MAGEHCRLVACPAHGVTAAGGWWTYTALSPSLGHSIPPACAGAGSGGCAVLTAGFRLQRDGKSYIKDA